MDVNNVHRYGFGDRIYTLRNNTFLRRHISTHEQIDNVDALFDVVYWIVT